MFGVTPVISVFGVVGNIFSIIVLIKQGMRKCSNILLVSLAFSDITFLISFNSVPKIIYEAVWNHEYVGYSLIDTRVLFTAFNVFTILDYSFGMMGLTLPMLITIERLVVIFLPLHFHRLVTPGRTWLAVVTLGVYGLSIFVYSSFWLELNYDLDPVKNTSVGIIQRSVFFYEQFHAAASLENFLVFSSMVTPPLFTVLGCLIISVKIKVTSIRRKKMTSKRSSCSRTTRTLLAVCFIYTVSSTILSLPLYIPQYMSYSMTEEHPSSSGKVFYQLINTAVCINSSSNFVVYVVLNKNFRETYKRLFRNCCRAVDKPGT
ncbi:unnamed protein product [Lymnaea stagnalis]|uniref:G-protein coupled receptors family 1 profile domain-containing protein n=1 Tax=Lymnaea stagnalis TaxID=6523 RepID=A0AAV2I279_LYMST